MTSPATTPKTGKPATFYVVPVTPDVSIENVLYYEGPLKSHWTLVSSKDLNARKQDCNAGAIMLFQPTEDQILTSTSLKPTQLDPTVSLYAGVVKTLGMSDHLESYYALALDGTLTINVDANTTRGLILIFTQSEPLSGATTRYPITKLIATTDPEIKNSIGGLDGD